MENELYIGQRADICFISTEYEAHGKKLIDSMVIMAWPKKRLVKKGKAFNSVINDNQFVTDFVKDIIWDAE